MSQHIAAFTPPKDERIFLIGFCVNLAVSLGPKISLWPIHCCYTYLRMPFCPLVAMSIISQVARLFVQISCGEVRSIGQRLARARFCSGEAVTSSRQEKQDASILHAIR